MCLSMRLFFSNSAAFRSEGSSSAVRNHGKRATKKKHIEKDLMFAMFFLQVTCPLVIFRRSSSPLISLSIPLPPLSTHTFCGILLRSNCLNTWQRCVRLSPPIFLRYATYSPKQRLTSFPPGMPRVWQIVSSTFCSTPPKRMRRLPMQDRSFLSIHGRSEWKEFSNCRAHSFTYVYSPSLHHHSFS